MAQRIHRFDIVSPADSPPISATTERVDFPPGAVTAITVEIPAGHHGLTGIRVYFAAALLIPASDDTWLKGTHKTIRYEFDDPHPGGIGWFVEHYNADHFYNHTFHFVVELDELVDALLALPPVILLPFGSEVGAADTAEPVPVAPGGLGGTPRI